MEKGYVFTAGISGLVSYYRSAGAPSSSNAKNWDIYNNEISYYYRSGVALPHDGASTNCRAETKTLEEIKSQLNGDFAITTNNSGERVIMPSWFSKRRNKIFT